MHRRFASLIAAALATAALAGCDSHAYDPHVDAAKLSSYAATAKYPSGATMEPAKSISFSVAGNGTITVRNASDASLGQFDLWVNKSYVLQVDRLDAKTPRTFAPEFFYNATGNNLTTVKSDAISVVDIAEGGKLMSVAGPVKE